MQNPTYRLSATKLCGLLLAALLLAGCNNEEELPQSTRVPIKLSVMTGSSLNSRTPGDPGEAEQFTLPKHAYIYVLTNDQLNEAGTVRLMYPGSTAGKGHVALNPDQWQQDAVKSEIYHYTGDINVIMPNSIKSGRVLAAVADREITSLSELPATPTIENMSQMTYSVQGDTPEEKNAFMKNLYATPYNLVYAYNSTLGQLTGEPLPPSEENKTDKLYYGTILDATEKVSHVDVVLYHVAARLDVKWEVEESFRQDNAITFFEIENLPKTSCYLFRPTENVDDQGTQTYTATESRGILNTSTAAGNLDPSTYWQGRRVVYVPQHYRKTSATESVYPFEVRLGKNGATITDGMGTKKNFSQPFTPDPVFTSWIAVGVNIKTQITN